jgi:DNA-directed RNA polymerase specialized sigma subunit
VGARSGRFLEFLLHAKSHYEAAGRVPTPDDVLSLKDTADRIKRVRQAARQLSQTDQQILHLRFDEEQTAKQISDELDLGGPRRVYSRLERIMLKLRYLITNEQVKK